MQYIYVHSLIVYEISFRIDNRHYIPIGLKEVYLQPKYFEARIEISEVLELQVVYNFQ